MNNEEAVKDSLEDCDTMLQQCSDIRRRVLETYINIGTTGVKVLSEEINFVEQVEQYTKLDMQLRHSFMLLDLEQERRLLYEIAYQQIGNQFEQLKNREENFSRKVDLAMRQKQQFYTEWLEPLLDLRCKLESMTFEEYKEVIKKLEQSNRIAADICARIQNLRVDWERMALEMNAGIRDCIAQARDLVQRVRLGQGISEE